MNTPTILLVEDDSNDAFFFQRALEKVEIDHTLRIACDGMEAIAYLKGEGEFCDRQQFPLPCLLVLDLNMPRKNGFEVLEWLRQTPPYDHLPAVVLTSSQADQDRVRACDLGAKAFYVKPANPTKLTDMIKAMLAECGSAWNEGSNSVGVSAIH